MKLSRGGKEKGMPGAQRCSDAGSRLIRCTSHSFLVSSWVVCSGKAKEKTKIQKGKGSKTQVAQDRNWELGLLRILGDRKSQEDNRAGSRVLEEMSTWRR